MHVSSQLWKPRLPPFSVPGVSGVLLVAILVAACSAAEDSSNVDDQGAVDGGEPTMMSAPPDGPLAEIGPAPDGYRPTAAGAPSTDIWVGTLVRHGTELVVQDLTNVTDRDGYDNQPTFSPDGAELYYASAVDSTQTEIMRIVLSSGAVERVTNTPGVSEFSPMFVPDGTAITAIHEQRGKQHLWRYGLDGTDLGPVFSTAEPVGYHAWADEQLVGMFILGASGTPATLQVGNGSTGEFRTVAENPGRSIHRIPGTEALSFVRKVARDEWWIERLDPGTGQTTRLVRTIPGMEDYAWTPEGEIVMGDGDTLFIWSGQGEWTELQALDQSGITQISRLAIDADGGRIAVVSSRSAGGSQN